VDESQFTFDFSAAAPARRIFGVRELVSTVRGHLEKGFFDVWVEGEISNLRPADSGHMYLTLKDGDSQLRVVMFRTQARLLRFRPQNGMQVIARGRVTLYEARGELQLLAEHMEPMGAGALQVAFEQLKAKLAAEGLFAAERKKPLPLLPRRLGIITSPRGAAIRDILNVLARRHQSLNVLIYPAQVQGAAAAGEVAAGIRFFNAEYEKSQRAQAQAAKVEGRAEAAGCEVSGALTGFAVDVILIARGGGSVEDLAAFNDEALARAIAASRVPVISAVGHETDFTICDFVADLRAPTPSAAAEIVVRSQQELEEAVAALRQRLRRAAQYKLLFERQRLGPLAAHRVFVRMEDAIARRQQRVDDLSFRLEALARARLAERSRRLELALSRLRRRDLRQQLEFRQRELQARMAALAAATRQGLMRRRSRLEQAVAKLGALSPVAILERGYSLVFDAQGTLVKDAEQLAPGDTIRARLARGEVDARVEAARPARPASEQARPGAPSNSDES
jgi:exodeoxyribonuclease VII large subunit